VSSRTRFYYVVALRSTPEASAEGGSANERVGRLSVRHQRLPEAKGGEREGHGGLHHAQGVAEELPWEGSVGGYLVILHFGNAC
jgi:hypothetical protein